MRFNAAIVGLGNIGATLDNADSQAIITHAHAFTHHSNTTLVGGYDIDTTHCELFEKNWSAPSFHSLNDLLKNTINIISICSPTHLHQSHLQDILTSDSIEYILCEKPFVDTIEAFESIKHAVITTNKKLLINYIRHFDPSALKVKSIIDSKELGEVKSFEGTFTKGLFHNGSHMLDLIELLINRVTSIYVEGKEIIEGDIFGSFHLQLGNIFGTIKNPQLPYSLFELDIVLEKGRIKILESGHSIEIYKSVPSKKYKGYFNLQHEKTLENSLQYYAKHSLDFLLHQCTKTFTLEQLEFSKKLLQIRDTLLHEDEWSL